MSQVCRGLVAGLACGLFLVTSFIVLGMWLAGNVAGSVAALMLVLYACGFLGAFIWMLEKK